VEISAAYRLVACLGNPGQQYENTRHNVGYLVADELARRSLVDFSFDPHWNADTAKAGGRTLMKPKTFMNLSGEAVGGFARYFKIPGNQVIVILDDISLPLGMVRLRKTGTAGGHNGLESVLVHLGTERVPRLRVGIGRPDRSTLHDHVLGTFDTAELAALADSIHRASDAFEYANAHGMDAAMNQFNQRNQEP
jgi:peptidyl-tRNA hydrolase, PTH1 family